MQNPVISPSSYAPSKRIQNSKIHHSPYNEFFSALENELKTMEAPLPSLKIKEANSSKNVKYSREKVENALVEAMQSQRYAAKIKRLFPIGNDPTTQTRTSKNWNKLQKIQFVSLTPSIPPKYESKLHELDPLIPQMQRELRSKSKPKNKTEIKNLNLRLEQVVPSQFLSPSFKIPDPEALSIPLNRTSGDLFSKKQKKYKNKPKSSKDPKPKLTSNSSNVIGVPCLVGRTSSMDSSNHILKANAQNSSIIDPIAWLTSKHPILDELPTSTENPNIQPLLSSFTQSVLKKCYLHEIHEALPPHRIAEAISKTNMERTIHNVLSGTQNDDVKRLNSLLPIDWKAKHVLISSKADITHQWEVTHDLVQKLATAEDEMIPALIDDSRVRVRDSKENRTLSNYEHGASYVLERETKFDYTTDAFHSSMRNLVSGLDNDQAPSNFSNESCLGIESHSLISEMDIDLKNTHTDLEKFYWEIDLSYSDEVQTFKSSVVRFLRQVHEGSVMLNHLTDKVPDANQQIEDEELESLGLKSKIMMLEKVFFPAKIPKPSNPDYPILLFTLKIAMHMRFPSLAESSSRLFCLITDCKVPFNILELCIYNLKCSLTSGTLVQQWASAFFLVKFKVIDPVIEFVKQKIGNPCPSQNYSVSSFLAKLPSHYFIQLATSLSSLLNHCSCHTREEVIKILKQGAMVWRQEIVSKDWLLVLGSHHVVVPDDGESLETFRTLTYQQEIAYPYIPPKYESIHTVLKKIVKMMFEDWYLPIRERCSEFAVDLDLLPLVMVQLNEMLLSNDPFIKKSGLRALSSMKWISTVAWKSFLGCFSSDYISIKMAACRTAKNLGLCHSFVIREILKKCLDNEPRVRAQAIHVLPHIATSPKAATISLNELVEILSNELNSTVKLQGARASLHLLHHIQGKTNMGSEGHEESITNQVKTLLSEWSTSEFQDDALLKKEALKCLATLMGGNTLLIKANNEYKLQEQQNQDKFKIIEKVRALGHRQQVLKTLMGLNDFNSTLASTSSLE